MMNKMVKVIFSVLCLLVISTLSACSEYEGKTETENTLQPPPGLRLPDVADLVMIKYNAAGDTVWEIVDDQAGNRPFQGLHPILDTFGHIIIAGNAAEDGLAVFRTAKYDSHGVQLWTVNYGPGLPHSNHMVQAVTTDDAGNIYVTGTTTGSNGEAWIITIKYDSNGQQLWMGKYQWPDNNFSSPSAINLDKTGNIYIAGTIFDKQNGGDFLVLKYDSQGSLFWTAIYDGPAHGKDYGLKCVTGDNSSIYVTGPSSGGTEFSDDYATVKFDKDGKQLWAARYNGPGDRYDSPHDIKLDSEGNVIVTGESDMTERSRVYATVKYNSDGKQLWVSQYNGPDDAGNIPSAMAVDEEGNIYVTGWSATRPNGSVFATVKYDPDGKQLWVSEYKGNNVGLTEANLITLDGEGNIYVAGTSSLDSQYITYDTVKYDTNGNELWSAAYSKAHFMNRPDGLFVDAGGNVLIIGLSSRYSTPPAIQLGPATLK